MSNTQSLEEQGLYYGLYEGVVTSNKDPDRIGRVRAYVPEVGHDSAPDIWIHPAGDPSGTGRGGFYPPEKGDMVWVSFDRGDPAFPRIYFGGRRGVVNQLDPKLRPADDPDTGPAKRGFVTRMGHKIVFDDTPGAESVRLQWHKPADGDAALTDEALSADPASGEFAYIGFEADGEVIIAIKNGSMIRLIASTGAVQIVDENGNFLNMTENGVTIADKSGSLISTEGGGINITTSGDLNLTAKGIALNSNNVMLGQSTTVNDAQQPFARGFDLISWLGTHTHGTSFGPSSIPLQVSRLRSLLSKVIKGK